MGKGGRRFHSHEEHSIAPWAKTSASLLVRNLPVTETRQFPRSPLPLRVNVISLSLHMLEASCSQSPLYKHHVQYMLDAVKVSAILPGVGKTRCGRVRSRKIMSPGLVFNSHEAILLVVLHESLNRHIWQRPVAAGTPIATQLATVQVGSGFVNKNQA